MAASVGDEDVCASAARDARASQDGHVEEAGEGDASTERGSAAHRRPDVMQVVDMAAVAMRAWNNGDSPRARGLLEELCVVDSDSLLWPSLLARAHLAASDARAALDACARAPAEALLPGGCVVFGAAAAEILLLRGKARLLLADREAAREDLRRASLLRGSFSPEATREFAAVFGELGETISRPTMAPPSAAGLLSPTSTSTVPSCSSASGAGGAAGAVSKSVGGNGAARGVGQPAATKVTAANPSAEKVPRKTSKAAVVAELDKARAAEKIRNLVQMRQHCEEVLRLEPGCPDAVILLARMEASNGRGAAAVKLLRQTYPAVLRSRPHNVDAFAILASVHEEAGDWDEAAVELERAAKVAPKEMRDTLLGCLARAKFRSGDKEEGVALAQRVLDEHPTQREACEVACAVLMDRGDKPTALAVMLRCLIAHRNEPSSASADLICGVMSRCSLEDLILVLNPQRKALTDMDESQKASVGEVVGYVGLILKERGMLRDACGCYREAALFAPLHASLCLNLMHCFSSRRDHFRAIAWGGRYFSRLIVSGGAAAPAARAVCAGLGLQIGDRVADAACAIQPTFSVNHFENANAFCDVIAIGFVLVKLLFLLYPYMPATTSGAGAEGPARGVSEVLPWRRRLMALDVEKEAVAARLDPFWPKTELEHFEAHRSSLGRLVEVFEASRQELDLHSTQVRNENAYFSCIRDILALSVPASPLPSVGPPIFVIGDSHVLSSAWQSVTMRSVEGQDEVKRTLVPCLVTGLKIWHLRQASDFHTKFSFWDCITAFPAGADIVLMLGEIDCREGIVGAVQKGRYADLEAALQAIINLYVEVVQEVRKRLPRGGGAIYVHPVPMVLPETRFLTVAFNQLLHRPKTVAAFAKHGAVPLELPHVLEQGERIYQMTGAELAKVNLLPELRLDGTHMSPSYVSSHLEPALSTAAAAAGAA
eukprot:TRINITY_DN41209_c0_g1_i1.p1 TRINITY_DN41209_c0_g1~~TRINITY_DN41209_c0_g1_i1.p1  ORF type:complete len:985 (+),score=164.35 TRINITY_DN41209_c0_g1_i1:124-2955(+)